MAIEAERGFQPTCYSCLITSDLDRPRNAGAPQIPGDPRLLLGDIGSTLMAQTFLMDSRLLNSVPVTDLPSDAELRALVGMMAPGQHLNAAEVFAGGQEFLAALFEPGKYFDSGFFYGSWSDHGGYFPIPPTASREDQIYVAFAAAFSLRHAGSDSYTHGTFLRRVERFISAWEVALLQDPNTPSLGEFIRQRIGNAHRLGPSWTVSGITRSLANRARASS